MIRNSLRNFGCILACGLVAGIQVKAAEPDALERGWTEFQFQMFDAAGDFFEEAAEDDTSRRQARLGEAMTFQFREKSPKLERAIEIYRGLLESSTKDDVSRTARALLAEALWESGETAEADEQWHAVITSNPDHIVAHDALMRRTLAHVGDMMSDETKEAIAYAEARRAELTPPTTDRPGLFPALDNLLGALHYWRSEYEEARAAYMRSVEIGSLDTTSPVVRGNVIMIVARISEEMLNDPKTAGEYYRKLVLELPTDVRSYFAMEKAVGYGLLTRAEIEAMDLNGLTAERIDQIMAKEER